MFNDTLDREQLVVAGGAISIYAGLGLLVGPYIEVFILQTLGARANFAVKSVIDAVVVAILYQCAKETLPVDQRLPLTFKDCSPFTFVDMLQLGRENQKLMLILLLQSFGEERVNQDINQLNLRDNLRWSPTEISTYQALFGASVILSGKLVGPSIEQFGFSGHTTLANFAMAMAFYCQGMRTKYTSQVLALMFSLIGGRKRDAVESTCSDLTLQLNSGMGKGQVSAALTTLKSLAMVIGPPIAAKAYNIGGRMGNPGLVYRVVALFYFLAEAVHWSLGRKLEDIGRPGVASV